jgi:hypothetical protein
MKKATRGQMNTEGLVFWQYSKAYPKGLWLTPAKFIQYRLVQQETSRRNNKRYNAQARAFRKLFGKII